MFIETEGTPNPATLKFLPGRYVMEHGTADFASPSSAERSPLATELFALTGVARVFLGGDFITVTKTDEASWQALKPQVLGAIMDRDTDLYVILACEFKCFTRSAKAAARFLPVGSSPTPCALLRRGRVVAVVSAKVRF